MGRHKNPRVTISLEPQVLGELREMAREAGVPLARLISRIVRAWLYEDGERVGREIMDRARVTREARRAYLQMMGEIRRVGSNLNQVARHLNSGGELQKVWQALDRASLALAQMARTWTPSRVLRAIRGAEDDHSGQNMSV